MNLRYQEHNKDNFTWNVERIIHAENHGGGIKLENNRKLIPNGHLPHVSYLVVSNEDEFQEHLRNVGESRILRSRSISKSRSKEWKQWYLLKWIFLNIIYQKYKIISYDSRKKSLFRYLILFKSIKIMSSF